MNAPLRVVRAAPPGESAAGRLECPLCGCPAGHSGGSCGSCPMGSGCERIICTRCGYRFVADGRWRTRLERWGRWARRLAVWT
jgi:hypothetical protein